MKLFKGVLLLFLFFINTSSALKITEIMFNPSGSDANREWIEVVNDTSNVINFSEYKFNEANVDHRIKEVSDVNLNPGEYAVIVQDVDKFKIDFPNYNGKIYTSSFSLLNTGELLQFKDKENILVDSVNYSDIASQISEGQSWQIINSNKTYGSPSPGMANTGDATNVTTSTSTNSTSTNSTSTISSGTTTNNTITNIVFTPIYLQERDVINLPKIYGYAGENKIVLKNVEFDLIGKIFDENKKEFRNGEFYWSFGDGTFSHEKNVKKIYKNTGEYTIILEVRWNDIVDTDKIYVKVIDPQIDIKINNNLIEITNISNDEIDLGNFLLKREDNLFKTFQIPKYTSILPKRTISFDNEKTNLGENINKIGIYYPNNNILKHYSIQYEQNPNNLLFNNDNVSTSTISVYSKEEFEKLKSSSLINENSKVASVSKKNITSVKNVVNKRLSSKINLNNDLSKSVNTIVNNTITATNSNKIILERPKSFWENLKIKIGF